MNLTSNILDINHFNSVNHITCQSVPARLWACVRAVGVGLTANMVWQVQQAQISVIYDKSVSVIIQG